MKTISPTDLRQNKSIMVRITIKIDVSPKKTVR